MRADPPAPDAPAVRPLHLLTGFLGSGKTALLRALLARGPGRIGVLVNEVGELGVDHHLLERVDDGILALPGGCVCCAIRGELHDALLRLWARAPDHIVLETTGVADPAPVLHGLGADPEIATRLRLDGVIAVVDCVRGEELAASEPEVLRQLACADRVVLTKTDLAPDRAAPTREWLAAALPGLEIRDAVHGAVDPGWLLAPPCLQAGGGPHAWLRGSADVPQPATGHGPLRTRVVRHGAPVDVDALQLWLRLFTQFDGDRLLRIKALARCRATGACFALQAAGRSVSPPQRLAVAPPDLRGAEVVILERGMPATAMLQVLDGLRAALGGARRSARVR